MSGDFDEELLFDREGGDDIDTKEVADISGSSSTGGQGVGGDENEIVPCICGRGNASSRARNEVDAMQISPSVKGLGEQGVNGIHVGENAHDGNVQNSGGSFELEAKIIADDQCESNSDAGTAPTSPDGRSGNGIRVKRFRTIRNGWVEHIYNKAWREWEEFLKTGCLVVEKIGKKTIEMDVLKVVVDFVLTPNQVNLLC